MHEAAAIQGALSDALAHMRDAGGARIARMVLVLGVSGHFTEDAARQHFAVNAQGTPAEDAALEIEWLPASYTCFECMHTFASVQPPEAVTCPACGGLALEIGHSDVCYIREIEVEQGEQDMASQFAVPAPMNLDGDNTPQTPQT
ncbi:MAG TPA: hydrogenase maturation nickel metallochaperone HypA [Ktedonobacterales bacterium]|nr:hydrogenase maturation nickel metallochaperone HypA [Ktedonobacterales bacterium]